MIESLEDQQERYKRIYQKVEDPSFAKRVKGFLNSEIGTWLLDFMELEEEKTFEEDLGELDPRHTMLNKGYIRGIRAIKSQLALAKRVAEMPEREEKDEFQAQGSSGPTGEGPLQARP